MVSKSKIISTLFVALLSFQAGAQSQSEASKDRAIELYNSSVAMIQSGDFAKAEKVLLQAFQLDPNNPNILCNYGLALMKVGKLQEAKQILSRGAQLKPDYDLVWLNLGLVQEGLGDLSAARASLAKFVELSPTNPYSDKIRAHLPEIDKLLAAGVSTETLNKPDYFDELPREQKQHWPLKRMPLKIYLKPADKVQGYKPSYGASLQQAMAAWTSALEGKLSFVPTEDPRDADVSVVWSSDLSNAVNRSEGGDVRYSANAAGLDHVDITLLTIDPSPTVKLTDGLVAWIAMHEFGHGLGIVGHSRNPNDVMYFSAPQKVTPQLSERDINTIRRLYSENLENWMTINADALQLIHQGQYAEALVKLDLALKQKPDDKAIRSNITLAESNYALQLMSQEELDQVEGHLKRALDFEMEMRDTNLDAILNNYAVFLQRAGRSGEIKGLFKRFGKTPPI